MGGGLKLEQQALPQVAGTDSGRFEGLDEFHDLIDLLFGGLDTGLDADVIGEHVRPAAQVAVVVDHAYDEERDAAGAVVQPAEAQLAFQALAESLLDLEGVVLRLEILALVVYVEPVRGGIVVVLADGDVLGGFLRFGGFILFQNGVLLEFLLDTRKQLYRRHLDQFDRLDLDRGEPLGLKQLLLKAQTLLYHSEG